MRVFCAFAFVSLVGMAAGGCKESKGFDGPTVDSFTGRVTQDGKQITLPADKKNLQLRVVLEEKQQNFNIPLKEDGSFTVGWMPIGKYTVFLEAPPKGGSGPPTMKYHVPGGLTIEEGKTDYTIELGKGAKL